MKSCSNVKCSQLNPQSLVNFYTDKRASDGLQSWCKACVRAAQRKVRLERPEEYRKYIREYNREWAAQKTKFLRENEPELYEKFLAKGRKRRAENTKKWREKYPARANANAMKRHAKKLQRTPPWLSKIHYQQIQIFYDSANALTKEFGILMEVDHIIPLQGKLISGLHVPWNLQVIPASENMRKGNR